MNNTINLVWFKKIKDRRIEYEEGIKGVDANNHIKELAIGLIDGFLEPIMEYGETEEARIEQELK